MCLNTELKEINNCRNKWNNKYDILKYHKNEYTTFNFKSIYMSLHIHKC